MSKLKVYVAGGWRFRHEIKGYMDQLRKLPYVEVTSNWIERENGNFSPKMLARNAENDYREIRESDVLFAIMTDSEYAYRGTYTEIGFATALGKKIIVWCPGTRMCKRLVEGKNKIMEEDWEYSHFCMYNVFYHHALREMLICIY